MLSAVLVGLATISRTASAQSPVTHLRVRIEVSPGVPIGGALVAMLDGNRVVAEGLSSARGLIALPAPPGAYRVRVRRIGFRPFISEAVTVPSPTELLLKVETDRVILGAMLVSASAKCGAITLDAQTLSTVWEEVSKALRSSQLTVEDLSGMGKMRTYRRDLGLRGEVVSSQSTLRPITNARPFGIRDPLSLSRLGYVRGDPQNGWEYFGPDEAVLLSDDFAATHCFKVVRDAKKRPGQIGVAFQPAPQRTVSDIKGILWVNEKTAALRDVGFTYVNAGLLTSFEPGGFTKFRQVSSGGWIVDEWQLRMPKLAVRYGSSDIISSIGFIENGGEIVPDTIPPTTPDEQVNVVAPGHLQTIQRIQEPVVTLRVSFRTCPTHRSPTGSIDYYETMSRVFFGHAQMIGDFLNSRRRSEPYRLFVNEDWNSNANVAGYLSVS
ncbi:MAG: carboxypeptidase-like regulatory domain-containing protein [Gemmatimonadaceae bacterium]